MERQKLEHALASEVLARQELAVQLKELQQFVVACSKLSPTEAKAALGSKAQEVKEYWKLEKKGIQVLEELEMHAAEEWVEERGLGPDVLNTLPSVEQRADHFFVEPGTGTSSPTVRGHETGKAPLIIGHS